MQDSDTPCASRAFWSGRRVFVTGHSGFKGSWLALRLQHLGAEVHGLALAPNTAPSLFETARVAEGMHSTFGDVGDLDLLRRSLAESQAEVVLHLAAQALVLESYDDPVTTFRTNVMGTVHLLEAVRTTPTVKAVVIVTSDKCYENREWEWPYRESDPMGGRDPYSSSKGCAELATAAFRDSFFSDLRPVAVATARAGNVIGGGDWSKNRLIPDAVRALRVHEPLLVRNPDAMRPWQHVLEPINAYLLLAQRLLTDGARHATSWNFGPAAGSAKPVRWVLDCFVGHWGDGATWKSAPVPQPHEARFLDLDCSRARLQLNWEPRLDLATALAWTASWYREFEAGADARELILERFRRFDDLARRR